MLRPNVPITRSSVCFWIARSRIMMVGSPTLSLIHFSPPIFVKYSPNSVPAKSRFLSM